MRYRNLGLSVIPLKYGDKRPIVEWKEYQERLPSVEEVRKWFSEDEVNIAIVCGRVSGNLVVLDFDDMDTFKEWYERIDKEHPDLRDLILKTWVVETGKGIHVYFRVRDPSLVPRTRPRVEKKPIDIKGEGGYVVAPPSLHPNGKQYSFRIGGLNDEIVVIEDSGLWNELLRTIGTETESQEVLEHGTSFRVLDDGALITLKELLKDAWVKGARQYLALFLSGWFAKARVHPVSTARLYVMLGVDKEDDELHDRLSTIYYSYRKALGNIPELRDLDNYIERLRAEGKITRNVSKGVSSGIEEKVKGKTGVQEILEGIIGEERALDVIRQIEEILGVSSPFKDSIIEIMDYDKQLYAVANLRKLVVVRAKREENRLKYKERVTIGAPTKVIVYINPLGGITKYEVRWETWTRPRPLTIGPAPIEDIVDRLKAEGLIVNRRLSHDIITAVLEGFVRKKKAEIREGLESPGFYEFDNRIIVVGWTPREVSKEELRKALTLLDELTTVWFDHVKDRFVTVIKWFLISPFIYVYKQRKRWVRWLYLYGPPDTGKSTQNKIGASIWGITLIEKPGSAVSTPARLEKILESGTFPVMVKEPGEMFNREDVTEMLKSAIEDTLARGKYVRGVYTETLALAPISFTSNRVLPREPGLTKRLLILLYTYGDRISEDKRREFKEKMEPRFSELEALGRWVANTIINNPELLNLGWGQLSETLLIKAYQHVGLTPPRWVTLRYEIEEDVYESIKESIRSHLIKRINEEYTRFVGKVLLEAIDTGEVKKVDRSEVDFEERIRVVLNNRLLPWAIPRRGDEIILTTEFGNELRSIAGDIGGLRSIAELLGWEYKQSIKVGKQTIQGIKVSVQDFIDFLAFS